MATQDSLIPEHIPLGEAPRNLEAIAQQERANTFPYWNGNVAFQLGCALRTRLLTFEKAVVIDISTTSEPGHGLFRAVSDLFKILVLCSLLPKIVNPLF
jgi:hypothetical protein